jgi:DNA topoisomerase-1
VALRIVCDRENEIERFKAIEYWSVAARLIEKDKAFEARLYSVDGKVTDKLDVHSGDEAGRLKAALEAGRFEVRSVDKKPTRRNPYAPFTTSSLQQDASSRLGFSPSRTMQLAQRLYEDGGITYMRTDGIDMAPEAVAAARSAIEKEFGSAYLPPTPRVYQNKAKNAQEAHEAIRPTDMFRHPDTVGDPDQRKLYGLIWRRTLASQMRPAEIERTTADIAVNAPGRDITLRAVGSVVTFAGFLAVYGVAAKEDRDADEEDDDSRELPPLAVGDTPRLDEALIEQHFTQPPSRYTEASLIRKMEELGIGRPSTYAATISVLQDRNYVRLEKRALVPEDRGRIVTAFLENFFKKLVEYGFTAGLEEKLDEISAGELLWKDVLRDFWQDFTKQTDDIKELRVSDVLDALNESLKDHIFPAKADGSDPRRCPNCGTGQLSLKLGKFGAFIGCSNYPECRYTMQLSDAATGAAEAVPGDGILGTDDESGQSVYLKSGRFGPYVQLGDGDEPKRSSLPKGWTPESLTLEGALRLLALPRAVGLHPETGKPISAGIGRYGPFVLHEGTYANLPDVEEVFTVGLNRAVDLLAQKAAGGGRFGARAPVAALKTFEHADGVISVRDGRYGPYVNQGKVNATLPRAMKPEDVTLEQALELLAERAAKKPARKAATKKAPAKKAAAKKAAPKKAAARKAAPKKKAETTA